MAAVKLDAEGNELWRYQVGYFLQPGRCKRLTHSFVVGVVSRQDSHLLVHHCQAGAPNSPPKRCLFDMH